MTIGPTSLDDLKPAVYNPRKISGKAASGLRDSIRTFGDISGIVWNSRTGNLVAGHQRVEQLRKLGARWSDGAIELPTGERFPVRVVDWDEPTERAANLWANNPTIGGEFTPSALGMLEELPPGLLAEENVEDLRRMLEDEFGRPVVDGEEGDGASETPVEPMSKLGEVYELGPHRLACGDCLDPALVATLFKEDSADSVLMLTDPPYCSGGFQETGKGVGSIGTKSAETGRPTKILNDTLSTRGYQALLREALRNTPAKAIAVFTDWRMWGSLFDVAESSGFGVRSLVVWDKETPGMGLGWRSQHELVLVAASADSVFENKTGHGNVIRCTRSGNKHHPTEKPVELLSIIIGVASRCSMIHDQFAGSGSSLLASAGLRRTWRGSELSPAYCDVIRRRWAKWADEHEVDAGPGALR